LIFSLFVSIIFVLSSTAQNNRKFKYPKTAFGAELMFGRANVEQSDLASDYDGGFNVVLRGLYQYNPKQWLGLSSGFGLDFRRYNEKGNHSIVGLQVPLLAQLRAGHVFSFNMGGDLNFLVYNNRDRVVIDGKPYAVDIVAYGGISLRLYKGLSFGTGIRWGLTPLYEQYKQLGIGPLTQVTGTHRGIVFSLKYMFY